MARKSIATYVENGYGQVEPNHLSAQRTAQIYAQLPAKSDITVLENGQFVKHKYNVCKCIHKISVTSYAKLHNMY